MKVENSITIYAFICFELMKYEDLTHSQKVRLDLYVKENDVKCCKTLLALIRPVRIEKMKTFIMCIRRLYKKLIPKDILWVILDYTYSPLKQRGKLT